MSFRVFHSAPPLTSLAESEHSNLMNIQKILKSANEIIALKRAIGMDAAPYSAASCMEEACKVHNVNVTMHGSDKACVFGKSTSKAFPVSFQGGAWETGWI